MHAYSYPFIQGGGNIDETKGVIPLQWGSHMLRVRKNVYHHHRECVLISLIVTSENSTSRTGQAEKCRITLDSFHPSQQFCEEGMINSIQGFLILTKFERKSERRESNEGISLKSLFSCKRDLPIKLVVVLISGIDETRKN